MKVDLKLVNAEVSQAFQRLLDAGVRPRPALDLIGETLKESTKLRFAEGRGPDGAAWEPNAESTYLSFLGKYKRSFKKDSSASAAGERRRAGKKPLIGETKVLSEGITYRLIGDAVEIGSPKEYAAVQQLGAKRGAFGLTTRGAPIPWGDIPARPFLGISPEDEVTISEILNDYLAQSIE
ncbi:MAG: phage virion morphogenesis protein [Panacagrimonas sp.]